MERVCCYTDKSPRNANWFRVRRVRRRCLQISYMAAEGLMVYKFNQSKEYNRKSQWTRELCQEVYDKILNGDIQAELMYDKEIKKRTYTIIRGKFYKDSKEYQWLAVNSILNKGVKIGDCVWVDTENGNQIVHIVGFDYADRKPMLKRAFQKVYHEVPFLTRQQAIELKLKKENEKNESTLNNELIKDENKQPGRPKKFDVEIEKEIVQALKNGAKRKELAVQYNVSIPTIRNIYLKYGEENES